MNKFKILALGILLLLSTSVAHANLILNGDFENNTAVGTMTNLSNVQFNSIVANATAFGTASEINLVTGTDFGIAPQSGDWKLGLHTQVNSNYDAFSLDLSSSIVAGMSYDLQFFAAGEPVFGSVLGPVEIGFSNSATNLGTFIFAGTPTGTDAWTQFDYSFTATTGASYLTVRTDPTVLDNYAFVDNFTLTKADVPEPATLLLLGTGLVGLVGLRRKFRT